VSDQSTEQLVPIADIRESVVILKNGSLCMVLEVSAINFELRSNDEQVAILQNFQNFINSVDFPLQIVVSSRRLKIEEYIKTIDGIAEATENELLKIQAMEYSRFVKELSSLSNIMTKKFYIVVSFYAYETPGKTGLVESFKGIFGVKRVNQELTEEQLKNYKNQLVQRAELVYAGLNGLGVKLKPLEDEDLKKFYYELYNPGK